MRHAFKAMIVGGELKIQPEEILDANWFSYKEITDMKAAGKLRVEWIYDAVNQLENQ